ncbi:MAG: family 10 glycosylhydrolase [Bacteroidetes bacterium]|nr:family 10 glycosylhydrolase [Bacteroidota bacterium]
MEKSTLSKLSFFFIPLFLFFQISLHAQPYSPKREFRGVWVATVRNIDYPRSPTQNSIAHREQWKKLLEKYKKLGFNAVIVQVRPTADAFYPSKLVPWSSYLTGKQGRAPQPDFDILQYMIESSHEQGVEFHAWLNPYRATFNMDTLSLSEKHLFNRKREWFLQYGTRFYFNPSLPEVRDHLSEVVGELVRNYDLDAIHFDDYFYPYKIAGLPFPDSIDFVNMGGNFPSIDDWRRNNVDVLIQQLSDTIKTAKPWVRFGISPFGVWRNKDKDPMGSDTRAGQTNYDDLYADVLNWLRNDWIDYVAPQLYWNIGYPPADFEKLLQWWRRYGYDKHIYIGQAAYKVGANQVEAWHDPLEIPRQIRMIRNTPECQGSIYFSSKSVLSNKLGIRDTLTRQYSTSALLPEMETLGMPLPYPPELKKPGSKKGAVKLKWKANKKDKAKLPLYYAIYRFEGEQTGNFENPENIIRITPWGGKKLKYVDDSIKDQRIYTYAITALNRQHSESDKSNSQSIIRLDGKVKRVKK